MMTQRQASPSDFALSRPGFAIGHFMLLFQHLWTVPLAVVAAATGFALVTDLWTFKVYNGLTFPLLLAGLLFHGAAPGGLGLPFSSSGMLCGFLGLIAFYALGGFGAGDVKLMAGIGAWLGPVNTLSLLIVSALLSGLCAVVMSWWQRRLWERVLVALAIVRQWMSGDLRAASEATGSLDEASQAADRRRRVMPFAAMVASGLVILLGLQVSR